MQTVVGIGYFSVSVTGHLTSGNLGEERPIWAPGLRGYGLPLQIRSGSRTARLWFTMFTISQYTDSVQEAEPDS